MSGFNDSEDYSRTTVGEQTADTGEALEVRPYLGGGGRHRRPRLEPEADVNVAGSLYDVVRVMRPVRHYEISGGRTRSRRRLGPEAIVRAATALSWHEGLAPEVREIVRLCHTATTLAEIAVALTIPLGVVDVLVDDLCTRGLVTVYQAEPAQRPIAAYLAAA